MVYRASSEIRGQVLNKKIFKKTYEKEQQERTRKRPRYWRQGLLERLQASRC